MNLIEIFFTKKLITVYNTKKSYQGNINKYFKLINKDIETYFNNNNLEQIEDDLTIAYAELEKQDIPLLTRRTFFNSIKQFLGAFNKETKTLDFWDSLKAHLKGASPISDEDVPNTKDIKIVLSHGNTLSRAMFLMMSCTGCRIGELLALYPEDIDLEEKPAIMKIKRSYDRKKPGHVKNYTKTKKPRICFLSDESVTAYNEWLKERPQYLKTAVAKSPFMKSMEDNRIFPMSDENAREIWANLVKRSGLYKIDSNTNRLTLHPHCLRKFFRSYFGHADLAEHFMGHATGMTRFYRNMKLEDLAKEYTKYMQNVTIFGSGPNIERVNNLQKQVNSLLEDNQKLRAEMNELKYKLLEEKVEKHEKIINGEK